jgi:hypothetical protein
VAGLVTDTASNKPAGPLFQLGGIVATPGALDLLTSFSVAPAELLARHVPG